MGNIVNFFSDAGDALAGAFGLDDEIAPAAAFDESRVADPSTLISWEGLAGDTTENVGRVWTDKSVSKENVVLPAAPGGDRIEIQKGDSDFLIGLSALSSASNTITAVSRPLDIALVLDTSGSMDDDFEGAYEKVFSADVVEDADLFEEQPTYYAHANGRYVKIDRVTWPFINTFRRWELNGKEVTPKASESDQSGVQFYEVSSRLSVLKEAVNGFLDSAASANENLGENSLHRVSLVTYGSSASLVSELIPVTSGTVGALKNSVDDLTANGATRADFGMAEAVDQLTNSDRPDAQKAVIFFTDGQPTTQSSFNPTVANGAIRSARTLKQAPNDALVYSIGVFSGADVEGTDNTNRFMQAVSSNYPNATSYTTDAMGDKLPGDEAKYYRTAADADSLNSIFTDIFEDIATRPSSPIITEEGADPNALGHITFTDKLGAYMEVDGFKDVIFADRRFTPTNPSGTTSDDGKTVTYSYKGTADANDVYPNGDMADLKVTVTKGATLAEGDTVEVVLPASLLPMRQFTVDTNEKGEQALTVGEQFPIRMFFGVSLKNEVRETLANGICNDADDPSYADDQALGKYIKDRMDQGKVPFYSNHYDGSYQAAGNKTLGNTTAVFRPAKTNPFYYFTRDTPIYTDKACEKRLSSKVAVDPSATYYYKRAYVKLDGAETVSGFVAQPFSGANAAQASFNIGEDADGAFIEAGSARLTRVDSLTSSKGTNATGTASEVINPVWDNIQNPDFVYTYLGNNGKLDFELAGAVAITKHAMVAPNKGLNEAEVVKDKKFGFALTVNGMQAGERWAEIRDAQNKPVGDPFKVAFDDKGKCTTPLQLEDEQTLYVYGLDEGSTYTVSESSQPAGFALTGIKQNGQDAADATQPATGTLEAGEPARIEFTNVYDVEEATLAAADFAGYRKEFEDWNVEDEFKFVLRANNQNNPMPEGSVAGSKTVTVTESAAAGTFGDVKFPAAGTFVYTISEERPSAGEPGVTYSQASYIVTVTVTDSGNGKLSAVSAMKKTTDDTGRPVSGESVADKVAVFTNGFDAAEARAGADAAKDYVDNSGDRPLRGEKFTFEMKPLDTNPANDPITSAEGYTDGKLIVSNNGQDVPFPQMTFGADQVGQTYTYELREVLPSGANEGSQYTVSGMTYDATVYRATFTAENEGAGQDARIKVTVTYSKMENGQPAALPNGEVPTFHNEYNVEPLEIPSDTASALKGSKTLMGRNSLDGEQFSFELSGGDVDTRYALANDMLVFGDDSNSDTVTVNVGDLSKDQPKEFVFGKMTFKQPGTYKFNAKEVIPADKKGGLTYDERTVIITVKVKDNNGALELDGAPTYVGSAGGAADAAAFVNSYKANGSLAPALDLRVGKTLTGRALQPEEFEFTITGVQSDTATADEANAKLANSDKAFKNVSGAASGVESLMYGKLSGMTFTEADAGKTFSYKVAEVEPAESDKLPGVNYDGTPHQVDIAVTDNEDGTLSASVAIDNNPVTGAQTISFANIYTADPIAVDTKASFGLIKVLSGRDWKAGDEFTFTMRPGSGEPMPMPTGDGVAQNDDGSVSVTVTAPEGTAAGAEVEVDFGSITFDKPGAYTYYVSEDKAGNTENGLTYASNTATVRVAVRDTDETGVHTGKLTATVTHKINTTFENVYESTLANGQTSPIKITKKLTGRDMKAGEFTFDLKALDGTGTKAADAAKKVGMPDTTMSIANKNASADGAVNEVYNGKLGRIQFDLTDVGKTYRYQLSEQKGGTIDKGVTYDGAVYTLEISVTDDGAGNLAQSTKVTTTKDGQSAEATVAAPNAIELAFENTYEAGEVTVDTSAEGNALFGKVIDGRDWLDNDGFTFTLAAVGGEADGAQLAPADVPVPEKVTATVGKAQATRDHDTYGKLAPFGFGAITFDKVGTYRYKVTENDFDASVMPGLTKDDHDATMTITVTDNGKGQLEAKATVDIANGLFVNKYDTKVIYDNATSGLALKKVLTGHEMTAGQFTFDLTAVDGKEATAAETKVKLSLKDAVSNVAGGSESAVESPFNDAVEFTPADAGKEYTFTVKERGADGAGYRYDTALRTVTIAPAYDRATGKLSVIITVATEGVDDVQASTTTADAPQLLTATFANSYRAEGSATLSGVKALQGREFEAADAFKFVVKNAEGTTVTTGVAKAGSGSQAAIAFDPIAFNSDAFAQDVAAGNAVQVVDAQLPTYKYSYTVSEDASSLPAGVSAVTGQKTVEVTVADKGDGTLDVKVPEAEVLTFTNVYGKDASATIAMHGEKRLDSLTPGAQAPDIEGKYEFVLEGIDGAPMPKGSTNGKKTVKNVSGNVDFGTVTYTMDEVFGATTTRGENAAEGDEAVVASAERTKRFTYRVTESGSVAGVTNDPAFSAEKGGYTFTVTVTDKGDGTLEANAEPAPVNGMLFTAVNTFALTPTDPVSVTDSIKVEKILTGRDMTEGEFKFELVEGMGDAAKVVATGSSAAAEDGKPALVSLSPITYTEPGVHTYTLREVDGGAIKDGVTFDDATYTVIATVTQNADATLSVEFITDAKGIAFENEYAASPATVSLGAVKTLENGELAAGAYEFQIVDADGKVVGTVSNGEDGRVTFDRLEFSKPGVYEFGISEVLPEDDDPKVEGIQKDGVTYDESVYRVRIIVRDNGKGVLDVKVEKLDGEPTFVNVVSVEPSVDPVKPVEPPKKDGGDELPRTGDFAGVAGVVALAGAGALLGARTLRRRA